MSGSLVWQHHAASQKHQRAAQFAAAASAGVVTLTSLDYAKAAEDAQRILDNSTGQFEVEFRKKEPDFVKVVQESHVVTQGTVHATAVESMTADAAVVLVAASSQVTDSPDATSKQPRTWRMAVAVTRDGDRIKMSKVEFVQ
jgi:Mce-associated membrane protein